MAIDLRQELERIDREIMRLTAQRELVVRLLGGNAQSVTLPTGSARIGRERKQTPLRPRHPENTQAILDAVAKYPGKTVMEIAQLVGRSMNADEKQITQIYNTVYGLARRGKIHKDESQRLTLTR